MDREEIVRMARIAVNGRSAKTLAETQSLIGLDEVERFAALAASAEREKLAAWMIQRGYATGHGDTIEDLLVELEWQVREAEREACAKVCEDAISSIWEFHPEYVNQVGKNVCTNLAAAIRARGETT